VQRSWSKWALIILVGAFLLGILAAIAIPAYQDYVIRAKGMA
jgi:Tfp pilus assembly protein PilE